MLGFCARLHVWATLHSVVSVRLRAAARAPQNSHFEKTKTNRGCVGGKFGTLVVQSHHPISFIKFVHELMHVHLSDTLAFGSEQPQVESVTTVVEWRGRWEHLKNCISR